MLRRALSFRVDPLALHARAPARYPFLLQSAAGHPQAARYDLLFAFPGAAIEWRQGDASDFFAALDAASTAMSPAPADVPPLPFAGGWFLLMGYEAAAAVEPCLRLPRSPYALPDALAVRCPAAVIVDRLRGESWCLAEASVAQLDALVADCEALRGAPVEAAPGWTPPMALIAPDDAAFGDGVARIQQWLREGDVFQVNLSRRWRAEFAQAPDPVQLYARLRAANPAPFAGLARWRGTTVVSSSPERLIEIEGPRVQTRPIAGTLPRGTDDDAGRPARLVGDLKERAEHVMLIDLERNDLGRVCLPGSVEVSELMTVESYAHVHHIVSNVRGRLRPGVGPGAALRAVFPGGTITGAPKVRAMQIIAELEGEGRGPYTGAMGYLSRCGRLDTNILIRTLVCEARGVTLRAGAGIVADSQPARELAETRAKARGLLLALGDPG